MPETAAAFFREQDDFCIVAHVSPDGDTIGSSLALSAGLSRLGKRARVVCEDSVPEIYRFLPGAGTILPPDGAFAPRFVAAVDCADLGRLGTCAPLFLGAEKTLNIDHHDSNTRYAGSNFVRHVAAAGELIFDLLRALQVPLDREIASCLFTAIATDTGNFAYSDTSAETFRVVAALLEAGIDLPDLNRRLFRTVKLRRVRLLGRAIANTQFLADGRIAVTTVTLADLAAFGAAPEDTDGIIDKIRDADTVEIAALLRESEPGVVRVGLRGKKTASVDRIALRYGGGGHKLAAGCTLHMDMAAAERTITEAAERLLAGESL